MRNALGSLWGDGSFMDFSSSENIAQIPGISHFAQSCTGWGLNKLSHPTRDHSPRLLLLCSVSGQQLPTALGKGLFLSGSLAVSWSGPQGMQLGWTNTWDSPQEHVGNIPGAVG